MKVTKVKDLDGVEKLENLLSFVLGSNGYVIEQDKKTNIGL